MNTSNPVTLFSQKTKYAYNPSDNRTDAERCNEGDYSTHGVIKRDLDPNTLIEHIRAFDKKPGDPSALKACFNFYSSFGVNVSTHRDMQMATGVRLSGRCAPNDRMSDYGKEIFQRIIDTIESDDITHKDNCCELIATTILEQMIWPFCINQNDPSVKLNKVLEIEEISKDFFSHAYSITKNDQFKFLFDIDFRSEYLQQLDNKEKEISSKNGLVVIYFLLALIVLLLAIIVFKK
jgi:hypothetical protein